MRIRADPDPHKNLQLVQVPIQNMTKYRYLQNYLFLNAGSGFGSESSMQIRIQGASRNADPCGSGSAQQFTTSTSTNTKYDKTCKIICFWTLDPDLDPHLLCRSGSKEPLIMRIRADPDLHNNLQLVQVLKNMTKYLQKSLFLDAGSGFGSTSSMRIRIQEASHNADPCGSGSATLLSRAMIFI